MRVIKGTLISAILKTNLVTPNFFLHFLVGNGLKNVSTKFEQNRPSCPTQPTLSCNHRTFDHLLIHHRYHVTYFFAIKPLFLAFNAIVRL